MPAETWTEERIETLRRLCEEGLPFRVIAERLGVTRNAALGKATRERIKKARAETAPRSRKFATESGKRILSPRVSTPPLSAMEKAPVNHKSERLDTGEPAPLMIPLLDLTENMCRWPVTGEPPHKFCGHEKSFGVSYCSFHQRAAFQKTPVVLRARKAMARAA